MALELALEILSRIEQLMETQLSLGKSIFSVEDASKYLGVSKDYIYKLCSERKLKHYKPFGKIIYFKRQELEEAVFRNPIESEIAIENSASKYLYRKI